MDLQSQGIILTIEIKLFFVQNLSGNDLGSRGARLVSESLRKNKTITKLNLSGNSPDLAWLILLVSQRNM